MNIWIIHKWFLYGGLFQSHEMDSNETKEQLFKILVLGDIGTGKTSIIKRYVHNMFSQHYRSTIGVDFALKVLNWNDDSILRLQLWDIAGQERYGNMTRVYYKEASGAIIVFDVSKSSTFEGVTKWKADLDAKIRLADGRPIPAVLLANKCDLEKVGRASNSQEISEFSQRQGFVGWFETSAKENIGIEDAMNHLVNHILTIQKAGQYEQPSLQREKAFPLTDPQKSSDKTKRKKSCCR